MMVHLFDFAETATARLCQVPANSSAVVLALVREGRLSRPSFLW
ncbi:hypothetical protein Bra1253DRAFT_00039 [Bradyrhizobium sp. WSM1253]|nr:hypothetical protein Bra1253DRAFT_00039 [Bradyrhizobium sp. WSM1253]